MQSPLDYFRLIEASIDEVLWLVSPDEKELYYISPAWERLTGISCQSLYDDPTIWKEALHPEDQARLQEISRKPSERRLDGDRSNEFRFLHPDGSIRWVWLRSRPVYDEQGNLIARCGTN
jgi:PAS domain S-box-containing protein